MSLENKVFDDPSPHFYPLQERVSTLSVIHSCSMNIRLFCDKKYLAFQSERSRNVQSTKASCNKFDRR